MFNLTLADIARIAGGSLHGADPGAWVGSVSTDTRTIQPGELYWALEGDHFDGHDFCQQALAKGGRAVVIQDGKLPGIELPCVRVPDTLWALGELARVLRGQSKAHVVGITGSVGKTSTKEYIKAAVKHLVRTKATEGNLNNLVGLPKTILGMDPEDEWAVLELGTDRPGEMKRLTEISQPKTGVITAIGEAHLDKLGSVEGVLAEKSELLKGLPPDGTAVIPHSSPFREELAAASQAPVITFGTEKGSDYIAVDPRLRTRGCYGFLLKTPQGEGDVELRIPGLHQVHAATAAAAVALSAGLPLAGVIEGLQSFTGLPGRCEIIDLENGITVIADHYNANPVSMGAALHLLETFLERRRVFVAGEMWDLGRRSADLHEMVGRTLGGGSLDLLVTVGPLTRYLVRGAREAGMQSQIIRWFENTDTAALELARMLEPSDVVLVKGSRGMKMEGIVDALTRQFGRKA